jgi:predicted nucleic acid-binding protein
MNRDAAKNAADIMGSLLAIGTPVNALDVLIAGIAMAYGPIK